MEEQKEKNEGQNLPIEPANIADVSHPIGGDYQNDRVDEPLRFVIDIPKQADNGEDAPPLLMDLESLPETTSVLLGVFDGMGGAGSEKIIYPDGTEKTNAYVGSRTTRQLVEQFFGSQGTTDATAVEQGLKVCIQNGLKEKYKELEKSGCARPSRIVSTLHKKLPTTMALSWYHYTASHEETEVTTEHAGEPGATANSISHNKLQLVTLWAGDSRCYALLPQKGLLQLTKDDNDSEDALNALMQAPQMTNSISASQDFTVNRRDYEIETPCMLFTASDGVFDYFPSPLLVEYNILNTLQLSSSVTEWRNRLQVILDAWKQDDVSMALDLPGFQDFDEVKKTFLSRYEKLKSEYKDMTEKADECTQVLQKRKTMKENIAKYSQQKQTIEISIQSIETDLGALSQKMSEIQKLIYDYKEQIEQLKAKIQSEESNTLDCEKEMEEKLSVKVAKEEEKAPWEKKIAEIEQTVRELNYDTLLNELRQKAVQTWDGYNVFYEEMLKRMQNDGQSNSKNNGEYQTEQQD